MHWALPMLLLSPGPAFAAEAAKAPVKSGNWFDEGTSIIFQQIVNANKYAFLLIDGVFGTIAANHFGISIIFLAYFTKKLLYPLYFDQYAQQTRKLELEPKVAEIRRYWYYDQLSAFIET